MDSTPNFSGLKAMYVNCTLKRSPERSNTERLMDISRNIMDKEGVSTDYIRLVDHNVATGMQPDMTKQGWQEDEWPALFEKIFAADILIIGSPIWLGEKSSVAQLLIERLYSMSGKKNDNGQYLYYGKAGGCLITGNEDGIKHCAMGILYALQHIGYTIPPQADAGWIGEAGPGPSYLDPESGAFQNEFTNRNTTFMTYNLMHMGLMLQSGYPVTGNSATKWEKGERWKFQPPTYD